MSAQTSERERDLADAVVTLADTLVDDYDVIELLHRLVEACERLLPIDAVGLLLAGTGGRLELLASSTESVRVLELFQMQAAEGPCVDCFTSGAAVLVPDLTVSGGRWPRFATRALREGFRAVHAVPLRLRADTIGALNLFASWPGALSPVDLRLGQALADVATIGILQERTVRRFEVLAGQLQSALDSRVVIEQAKGVLAERGRIDPAEAFTRLRGYARSRGARLNEVARSVVEGEGADLVLRHVADDAN